MLADKPDDTVEVSVKLPAHLHTRLGDFCARDNLKVEELVSDLINKWLLSQTIAILEGKAESGEPPDRPGLADRG